MPRFASASTGVQRGAVLDLRGDDVPARAGFAAGDAEDCEIVRFRAAAGESNFRSLRANQRGHGDSGAFHGAASSLSEGVDGTGIAKFRGKIRQHRRQDFRVHGRGGIVIEINAMNIWQARFSSAYRIACEENNGQGDAEYQRNFSAR